MQLQLLLSQVQTYFYSFLLPKMVKYVLILIMIIFNLLDLDKIKEELENSKQEVKDLLEDKEMLTKEVALKDEKINMLNRRLDKNKS